MTKIRICALISGILTLLIIGGVIGNNRVGAEGISMAPLEYQTNLDGQIKKGAVDITNSSGVMQSISIQVRAFRQVNNHGDLQFYEDPTLSAGIIPDYQHFSLKPYETIHLFFLLNGQKLPKQQLFAALFAQATPEKASYNITPILRVGTLLILRNGADEQQKQGSINNWNVSFLQFGKSVSGSFDFKNTENGNNPIGFFPKFKISLAGTTVQQEGNLVFPGIEREQRFNIPGSRVGIYKLSLSSDANAGVDQWVLVVTGYWRWLLPLLVVIAAMMMVCLAKRRSLIGLFHSDRR